MAGVATMVSRPALKSIPPSRNLGSGSNDHLGRRGNNGQTRILSTVWDMRAFPIGGIISVVGIIFSL